MTCLSVLKLIGAAGLAPPAHGLPSPRARQTRRRHPRKPFVPVDPYVQVATMHRGMNVLGYDPVWFDPAKARFQPRHFARIHEAGFDTVRIVLQGFDHMDEQNRLDPAWLATVDTMLNAALAQGLNVDLDLHYNTQCGSDPKSCEEKIDAFWSQLAPRYANAPNRVMFELLNEPHGMLDAPTWNAMLRSALATVRASNPTRNLIIGTGRMEQRRPACHLRPARRRSAYHRHGSLLLADDLHAPGCCLGEGDIPSVRHHLGQRRRAAEGRDRFRRGEGLVGRAPTPDLPGRVRRL